MCWLCDNPGATNTDYLRMVRDRISTHGWAVQSIEEGDPYPPFSYTVGRTGASLPELVVTGLRHIPAQQLLNTVAAQSPKSGVLTHGDHLTAAGMSLEVVELSDPTAHLHTAVEIYGKQITALQLVHADHHGIWPWSPNYSGAYRQPVLGPRSAEPSNAETPPQNENPRS